MEEDFSGYTSELAKAGDGVLHALKNCSVLVVGKHWGGFQDGLIDMSGEGQKYTYFGYLNNIVLVADTNEDFEKHEQQKKNDALRRAGHKLAEFIGQCVKELTPEDTEVYDLEAMIKRSPEIEKLPSVVYVMQPQSQMENLGYNDLAYGWDMNRMLPTVMHPNEVLMALSYLEVSCLYHQNGQHTTSRTHRISRLFTESMVRQLISSE